MSDVCPCPSPCPSPCPRFPDMTVSEVVSVSVHLCLDILDLLGFCKIDSDLWIIFLIFFMNSIWDAMHDRLSYFR